MPAIGFGLAWGGYTGMLWAWCLLRGYNVTLGQLVNPVHLLNWKTATAQLIPQGQIMPGGAGVSAASSSGGTQPGTAAGQPNPTNPGGTNPKVVLPPKLA